MKTLAEQMREKATNALINQAKQNTENAKKAKRERFQRLLDKISAAAAAGKTELKLNFRLHAAGLDYYSDWHGNYISEDTISELKNTAGTGFQITKVKDITGILGFRKTYRYYLIKW